MLKQIAVSEIELGMFVHKMEGSWFKHPFWKSRFLVDDPESLRELHHSDLKTVITDTSRGKDTGDPPSSNPSLAPRNNGGADPGQRVAAYQQKNRAAFLRNRESVDLGSTRPTQTGRELGAARQVAEKGQKVIARLFTDARLGKTVKTDAVEPVLADIYASIQRNPHAFSSLMRCKLNNQFVYRHSLAVSALMIQLARKMKWPADAVREAGLTGMLMDLGTNYLPNDPPPANGDFRNAEPEVWERHVLLGFRALQDSQGASEAVMTACLQHHERLDGSGFPNRLQGPEICTLARMAAICDTFDYLLTECNSAQALDPAQAIVQMKNMHGAFDPEILRQFIETVGVYPVGSFVRLQSERLAMVIDEDPENIDKPVVIPFYSLVSERRLRASRIELARCWGEDAIVGLADLTGLLLPQEAQLRELLFFSAHQIKVQ